MVSNKNIKDLDFSTIEEYFNYIVESEINGQRSQVHSLIDKLSKLQKKAFLEWLNDCPGNDSEVVKNIVITSI